MEENTVVTSETTAVEQTEPVKTEPAKTEPAVNPEVEKLKAALTKASADAAEWKRQLRERQSAEEREKAERAEQEQTMREELEAGRPVIYSDLKAIRRGVHEIVDDSLVKPTDLECAAKMICALVEQPERYKMICERNRHLIENKYNWDLQNDDFVRFITNLSRNVRTC